MASSGLLLFFLFSSSAALAVSFQTLNPEVVALAAIREELSDPHGVLSNWDEYSVDPCSWAMITCSPDKLVIGLGAPSQSLSGSLSPAIGNLTNLQQVLMQSNNLSGAIPGELGRLSKLETLDLSNNGFAGAIPYELGRLSSLRYLRLNNNSLNGSIPQSLSRISQLSFLDLSFNNLSAPLTLFPAKTFNIVGNPLICGNRTAAECWRASSSSPVSIMTLPSFLDSHTGRSRTQKLVVAVGASVGSTAALFLSLSVLLWWHRRHKRCPVLGICEKADESGREAAASAVEGLGNLRRFGPREVLAATESFSGRNILGIGGFGVVYRGRLADGMVVAVKRLKDCGGGGGGGGAACGGGNGEAQFRTEVEMISLAVHRNLLKLIGYCVYGDERILVYPFMANGSVASRLRAKPTLDWGTRKRIALGAARGLLYLHEQCDPKIIHRDVKAANILLDESYEAVVGDFGLAKLLDHDESHVTTAVRGTVGHIAPEYLSTGQSSDKTDVFGFGILLLELVTGRRALDFGKGALHQKGSMLDWVRKVHQEKQLDLLVDRDLRYDYDHIEVGEMVQVALLCTQYLPANRPKMSEVVRMLEGDGLADKWEACNRPLSQCIAAPASDRASHYNTFFVMDSKIDYQDDSEDLQGRSMEAVEEMELSGPR